MTIKIDNNYEQTFISNNFLTSYNSSEKYEANQLLRQINNTKIYFLNCPKCGPEKKYMHRVIFIFHKLY